jgi:hypothetical protein
VRSLRHSVRLVGLVVLALATGGGAAAGTAHAGPVAALVERAPVESTAPARRAARTAPRPGRARRVLIATSARPIDRSPCAPVARRAVPPRRAKSPTYVVHRALLR